MKLCRARALVIGKVLRVFKRAVVLEIGGDPDGRKMWLPIRVMMLAPAVRR